MSLKRFPWEKLVWCFTVALVGGFFTALAGLLAPPFQAFIGIASGFFIAGFAYKPEGRHISFATVLIAFGSCLLEGIGAGLCHLMLCIALGRLGGLQLSNCAKHDIDATIFAGSWFSGGIVMVMTFIFLCDHLRK